MNKLTATIAAVLGALAMAVVLVGSATSGEGSRAVIRDAALGKTKPATLQETSKDARGQAATAVTKTLPWISAGTLTAAKEGYELDRGEAADEDGAVDIGSVDLGDSQGTLGCARRDSSGNTRVNQDCGFRRQAEEDIVFNPADPKNLIAGQNDSRVGFNQCGIDWSLDNGRHWGDMLPPFRGHLNSPTDGHTIAGGPGSGHTYDAGSDPVVAFDADGRAFFSCVIFDINSNASGVYVMESPAGAKGSFYNTLGSTGSDYIAVEDNEGLTPDGSLVSHDKEFIVADTFASSPNKNNVYVTWTVFYFDPDTGEYRQSPIFGSMTTDHAKTWSQPENISGSSAKYCFFGDSFSDAYDEHACNFSQGSDPVVLPNGDLVVTFNNGNTPADVPYGQQLAVHCHPGDGHLNCGSPVRVGFDVLTGAPGCDFGRGPEQCIVGPNIRTNDFPRITVGEQTGVIYVAWQDYRNGEYDIQLSRSTNGGSTWSDAISVNPSTGLDHYFPAIDVAEKGSKDLVAVGYYRSETNPGGQSDYGLAGGWGDSAGPFEFKVLSPAFPPPNGIQAGFNGDYSGITVNKGDDAHVVWSDTRNTDPFTPPAADGPARDEDIFTDKVNIPHNGGTKSKGQIGKS